MTLILKDHVDYSPEIQIPVPLCKTQRRLHNITICTKPFFKAHELLHADPNIVHDWVAYHKLLGVDHVQLYDTDGSFEQVIRGNHGLDITYVDNFPHLVSKVAMALHADGYFGSLVSLSYDHCIFQNALTSKWVLHLHGVDSWVHMSQRGFQRPDGFVSWLESINDQQYSRLCGITMTSVWFGGKEKADATLPLFARFHYRMNTSFDIWNQSETVMRAKNALYMSHKAFCEKRSHTFTAQDEIRTNHFVNMERKRCDACTTLDNSAEWATSATLQSRAQIVTDQDCNQHPHALEENHSFGDGEVDSLKLATTPSYSKNLEPHVAEPRPRPAQVTAKLVHHSLPSALHWPKRFDRVLDERVRSSIHEETVAAAWRIGKSNVMESLFPHDFSSPSLSKLLASVRQMLDSETKASDHGLTERSEDETSDLADGAIIKAVGLLRFNDAVILPNKIGKRFIYFPHTLQDSDLLDGSTYAGAEFDIIAADGHHMLRGLPLANTGYLMPANWSVRLTGPSHYLPEQLLVCIVADIGASTPAVIESSLTVDADFGPTSQVLFRASTASSSTRQWLGYVHVFQDALPQHDYLALKNALLKGTWTYVGKKGTGFLTSVDRSQEIQADADVLTASAALIDTGLFLSRNVTGLDLSYYHGYAIHGDMGHATPLHQDVGAGDRRLWTFLYGAAIPPGVRREFDLYSSSGLQHLGTLSLKENSAILYPAALFHAEFRGVTGPPGADIVVGLRLAICSQLDVAASGDDFVEVCYP